MSLPLHPPGCVTVHAAKGLCHLGILSTRQGTLGAGRSRGGEGPQSGFLGGARVEELESPEHLWITSRIHIGLWSRIMQMNEDSESWVAVFPLGRIVSSKIICQSSAPSIPQILETRPLKSD